MTTFDMLWGKAQTLIAVTVEPIAHKDIPEQYDDPDWPQAYVVRVSNLWRPATSWFEYYAFAGVLTVPLSPKQHFQQFLAALSDVEAWTDAEIIENRELLGTDQQRRDIAIMRENACSFKFLVEDDFYNECVQVGEFLSNEDFTDPDRSEQ
jgi:hypothetical protein